MFKAFFILEAHSQTTKKDSQIAEVTVGFKGGAVLHASERTEDMYASIDIVSHKLAQSMKVKIFNVVFDSSIRTSQAYSIHRNTMRSYVAKDSKKNLFYNHPVVCLRKTWPTWMHWLHSSMKKYF